MTRQVLPFPPDRPGAVSRYHGKTWHLETQAFMVALICEVCRDEYGLTPQQITDAFCIEHTTGWYAIKEGAIPTKTAPKRRPRAARGIGAEGRDPLGARGRSPAEPGPKDAPNPAPRGETNV